VANRLQTLRERLGFSVDEVALVARLSRDELRQVEALPDPHGMSSELVPVFEDLYGVDIERWLELPEDGIEAALPPVATLLRAQADVLGSATRFSIAEATTVARHIRDLQRRLGIDTAWPETARLFSHDSDYSQPAVGERLARQVRDRLELAPGSIPSMRKLLERLGIVVLWEQLPRHIDALALASDETGGVIVANANGPHMANAFLRRVSFAHELLHLLYDRSRMQQVERFCATGRNRAKTEDIESRARAFTMYFLAPRDEVETAWAEVSGRSVEQKVRSLMTRFGAGYEAMRHHLHFLNVLHIDEEIGRVDADSPPDWEQVDPSSDGYLERKALDAGVSPLRAGELFGLVWRAYRNGELGDSAARDELRLHPSAWQQLKLGYAGERGGRWSTSSAKA
jgi:Zn-dependent peptidase ImmA (M78 family)